MKVFAKPNQLLFTIGGLRPRYAMKGVCILIDGDKVGMTTLRAMVENALADEGAWEREFEELDFCDERLINSFNSKATFNAIFESSRFSLR